MVIQSLPVRGAWIEISSTLAIPSGKSGSLPVRGARIEMIHSGQKSFTVYVAPCEGSED